MSNQAELYEVVRSDGTWYVYTERLKQIIRSYTSAEVFLKHYAVKPIADTEKDSSMLESVSSALFEWFTPDVKVVDMDMKKVRQEINDLTDSRFNQVLTSKHKGMQQTKQELIYNIQQGKRDKTLYRSKNQTLQKANQKAIKDSCDKYDIAIEGAKITRDASIDTFILAGTVATGGTGAALAGLAGTAGVAKGLATYQDTSDVGAAVVSGTVGAMTTLLKIPADKMPKGTNKVATDCVIVFIEGVGDFSTDMITGKTAEEAFFNATIKHVTGLGIGAAANKVGFESQLKKVIVDKGFKSPVPSMVAPIAVAQDVLLKSVHKGAQVGVVKGIDKLTQKSKGKKESCVIGTAGIDQAEKIIDYIIQKAG